MKLKYIFILSIITLLITALFSAGYYHFDEHFQILEFAGLKLKMTEASNLPWEYQYQMRPALQPLIVVLVFDIAKIFGISDPFVLTTFLRILSAGIAFSGMYLLYNAYARSITDKTLAKWFLLLSFFLWFMIFNNVRFSSESWSGSLFLIGFALSLKRQPYGTLSRLGIGLILGLSFLFRYQAGFLILGFFLWHIIIKKEFAGTILMATGVAIMIGAGILADRWFYGEWTLTTWNYFYQNIILHKSAGFGVSPWWYYFVRIFYQAIPPFSVVFIVSLLLYLFYLRTDLLTWTLLPFLLIHILTGHKELRFLFPVIGFLPVLITRSIEIIKSRWKENILDKKIVKISAKLFWIVNIVFLTIIALKPADNQISLYRKLYRDYNEPATLYYIGENPFNRVLDIYFYKRPDLSIEKVDSLNGIEPGNGRKQLLATKDYEDLKDLNISGKQIYSSWPGWIRYFNFNNWISRTATWYVYEL